MCILMATKSRLMSIHDILSLSVNKDAAFYHWLNCPWWCHMASDILDNIGSGNGLLPAPPFFGSSLYPMETYWQFDHQEHCSVNFAGLHVLMIQGPIYYGIILMAWCKTAVSSLLMQWRYCSVTLSHWYTAQWLKRVNKSFSDWNKQRIPCGCPLQVLWKIMDRFIKCYNRFLLSKGYHLFFGSCMTNNHYPGNIIMVLFSHNIGKMACSRTIHLFNKNPGPIGDLMLSYA